MSRFAGVSVAAAKAAGLMEDDAEAAARVRAQVRASLVAGALARSRAFLATTPF